MPCHYILTCDITILGSGSTDAINLCTVILPWGKYKYKRLPMGVCNSPDVFQGGMNKPFQGFEYICVYIDDLLVLTTGDWAGHLTKLEKVLIKLQEKGIKFYKNVLV